MKIKIAKNIASLAIALCATSAWLPAAEEPSTPPAKPVTTAVPPAPDQTPNCLSSYRDVAAQVTKDPGKVLEIVSDNVKKTPKCSCEIVKAAIVGSKADAKTVAAIVETAMGATTEENWPMIVQCALAVAPDAYNDVRKAVTRIAGDNNSVAAVMAANPLDFPGSPGSPPGKPNGFPFIINPPKVTGVNFLPSGTTPRSQTNTDPTKANKIDP